MAWTVRVHTENSAHLYLAVCNRRSSTSSILQISGKQNDASPNICMLHIIQALFACSFSYSHEECYCQLRNVGSSSSKEYCCSIALIQTICMCSGWGYFQPHEAFHFLWNVLPDISQVGAANTSATTYHMHYQIAGEGSA